METKSKAETFVGFAIRAGKYRTGLNSVQTLKKAYLILVCRSASDNTKKEAKKTANKYKCDMLISVNKDLSEMIHKDGVKVMAVTDCALAKAIKDNYQTDFIEGNLESIYG